MDQVVGGWSNVDQLAWGLVDTHRFQLVCVGFLLDDDGVVKSRLEIVGWQGWLDHHDKVLEVADQLGLVGYPTYCGHQLTLGVEKRYGPCIVLEREAGLNNLDQGQLTSLQQRLCGSVGHYTAGCSSQLLGLEDELLLLTSLNWRKDDLLDGLVGPRVGHSW